MSKDNRIYIRCDAEMKKRIDVAAELSGKSVGYLTRILWMRFLEDQGDLIRHISSKDERQVCPRCNSLSQQQDEPQS